MKGPNPQQRRNILITVVSVLATAVLFCLCYTLIPRSWDTVSREAEMDRLMGTYHVIGVQPTGTAYSEVWQIDGEHGEDSPVLNAFANALQEGSYRAELRNVMNYTPLAPLFQDSLVKGLKGSVSLYLMRRDNMLTATVTLYDTYDYKVHVYVVGNPNTFFYHVDGKTYDALANLMREYGTHPTE